jgi:hypothetical protein
MTINSHLFFFRLLQQKLDHAQKQNFDDKQKVKNNKLIVLIIS